MVLIMRDLIQELFDILDKEYRDGGIDARAYAALKGSFMALRQRMDELNILDALNLYHSIKAVMNV